MIHPIQARDLDHTQGQERGPVARPGARDRIGYAYLVFTQGGLMDRLDFGAALAALKGGQRVARAGWNGKGMWLGLVRGDGQPPEARSWSFTNGKWDNYSLASFIAMKTADDKFVPWLASQTDMLSEDWEIVGDG